MILGRRGRLFGDTRKSAFVREQEGGGGFTGLLDDYPGAAAAYSLRLLRSDYAGGLVRVMAWNGSASQGEADIMGYKVGNDYVVDLNSTLENLDAIAIGRGLTTSDTLADLVLTGTSNYDGLIPNWYDQSGNSNNASQTTAAYQGFIVQGGLLNSVNGKPAIKFTSTLTALFPMTNLIGQTVFSVTKSDVYQVINYVAFQSLGTKGLYVGGSIAQAEGTGVFDGSSYFDLANENLLQRLDYWNYSGAGYNCSLNGGSPVNVGTTPRLDSIDKLFGRQQFLLFLNGNAQEVVFYNTDNSTNKSGIETNINDFYSIY